MTLRCEGPMIAGFSEEENTGAKEPGARINLSDTEGWDTGGGPNSPDLGVSVSAAISCVNFSPHRSNSDTPTHLSFQCYLLRESL